LRGNTWSIIPYKLFRELAYEVAVPARYGDALIREIMAAGEEFDITPYGTEALGVMRIEKGHVTGAELNGQMTAFNVNMNNMISQKKDSIGSVLSRREVMVADDQVRPCGRENC
jgi:sarcosine oxidase subunit alpha